MDVSSPSAASSIPPVNNQKATAPSSGIGSVDYNTFLQLLIAQAKNQDPTNPTDPSQYIQQFATLSQVEQAVRTNSKLDEILTGIQALKPAASEAPAETTSNAT
jgi:flagellar basal-body rod modification protein FlgD